MENIRIDQAPEVEAPRVFISYSWDSSTHKAWTKELAARLRSDGIDVTLDHWTTVPGDRLTEFMERAIRENSYVLIVCTPNYKAKTDGRKGGVGYEGDIMTAEVFAKGNHRKFIPVLRDGDKDSAIPTWLSGKYHIDLRNNPYSEDSYKDLLATLQNRREQAPPIGLAQTYAGVSDTGGHSQAIVRDRVRAVRLPEWASKEFEPIKIIGVLTDEIGEPRNDGTRGSALYEAPFKLSGRPRPDWARAFIENWDHPPSFTSMHRPGTAEVRGDRIILKRTTIDEVKQFHRKTLILAVDETNKVISEYLKKNAEKQQQEADQKARWKEETLRKASEIKFD
jgi:hypothetical protein